MLLQDTCYLNYQGEHQKKNKSSHTHQVHFLLLRSFSVILTSWNVVLLIFWLEFHEVCDIVQQLSFGSVCHYVCNVMPYSMSLRNSIGTSTRCSYIYPWHFNTMSFYASTHKWLKHTPVTDKFIFTRPKMHIHEKREKSFKKEHPSRTATVVSSHTKGRTMLIM